MVVLALALVAALAGCRDEVAPPPPVTALGQTIERGPVRIVTSIAPDTARVGDVVTFIIEVTTAPDIEVTMPEVGDELGSFEVRSRSTPPDLAVDDGRQWRHVYELSTFDVGTLEVPGVEVSSVDRRDPEVPIESTVETEPIAIEIASVLTGEVDPSAFRDIADVVEVPLPPRPLWHWGVLAAALAALAVVTVLLAGRRRAKRLAPPPPVPPHVWAREELARLRGEGLLEAGRYQPFYVRLSDVVRQYVERRFGLMAPERTTEEFLREAQADERLTSEQRTGLASFLRAADLVKFARHQPGPSEGEAALESADAFVEETTRSGAPSPASASPAGEEVIA